MEPHNQSTMVGLTAKGEPRQYVKHSYTDRCQEADGPLSKKDEVILKQYDEDRVGGAFPLKLHIILKILEKEGSDHIFSWLPHGRAFGIHRNGRFEEEVVKRFFKQSQISSFRRQLNLYGFIRISNGRDAGAYYHELFLRGKPLLSLAMTRTRIKGTKIRASSSPDNEPHFYSMPFLGVCIRPEYAAQAALEKNMMMSSMNQSMIMGLNHQDRNAEMRAFNPYMDANNSGMRAVGSNSSFSGRHDVSPSSAALNKNALHFQQNQFPSIMGDRGVFMNPAMSAAGTDTIANRQLALERDRLQQQRMIELMNMNGNGNVMQNHHNTDFRNERSVESMNMQSITDMNMNGMSGMARLHVPSSNNMQERTTDSLKLMEQNMMQQYQSFAQFHRLTSNIPSRNMPSGLLSSSFPYQGMVQGSNVHRQFSNQGMGPTHSPNVGGPRDLLLHQQKLAMMRESMRPQYPVRSKTNGNVAPFPGANGGGFNGDRTLTTNTGFASKEGGSNGDGFNGVSIHGSRTLTPNMGFARANGDGLNEVSIIGRTLTANMGFVSKEGVNSTSNTRQQNAGEMNGQVKLEQQINSLSRFDTPRLSSSLETKELSQSLQSGSTAKTSEAGTNGSASMTAV